LSSKIDASKLPEYKKFASKIERLRTERIDKVQQLKSLELQSLHDWTAAQKKQAWDDFYVKLKMLRSTTTKKF
jgi:hypothetical protein